jgi:hypothetical protein
VHLDPGALSRAAIDAHAPAQELDALPHTHESLAIADVNPSVKTCAVIVDRELHRRSSGVEVYFYLRSVGMLANVCERFLSNPV